MNIIKDLKLSVYFIAIFYSSLIILFSSIFYGKTFILSNLQIAKVSALWLALSLFLWMLNDCFKLLGNRVESLHDKGKKCLLDYFPGATWTGVVILMHVVVFVLGIVCSYRILV